MKQIYITLYLIVFCNFIFSQTFSHPTTGQNLTYSGGCPEHTCSGMYYDDGGPTNNYSDNINRVYQTFCPDQDDVCLEVTFNSFNTETTYDYLQIGSGPAQNSPYFTTAPADASGQIMGTPATPFSYTSNHSSGCLTFTFTSDGSVNRLGWEAVFSCAPCSEREPNGLSDCATGAQQVCSNDALPGNSPGPGSVGEGCAGCAEAEGETFSAWYYFEIAEGGQLAFDMVPDNTDEDLDFALYGPDVNCNNLDTPIRCSYAMNTGTGGMRPDEGADTEGVFGAGTESGWVNDLTVTTGERYVLLINNWSDGGGGYTINWTGTADLECNPFSLPVDLLSFEGKAKEGHNLISWSTAAERQNHYFLIEKSTDGSFWYPVAKIDGAGNSTDKLDYELKDEDISPDIIQYYRLKQFDFDGTLNKNDQIIAILNNHPKPHVVKVINILGQEVKPGSTEFRIEIYSDGSRIKRIGE